MNNATDDANLDKKCCGGIYVIIPAYEPNKALHQVCMGLKNVGINNIVVVDDGSGVLYHDIFQKIEDELSCIVLRHAINLGKGRALKTAFNYLLVTNPNLKGVVTADSDGQHTPEDIKQIVDFLQTASDSLILGVRDFGGEGIPWKSKFGNELTKKVFAILCGVNVSDTQTGLRGIPRTLMEYFLTTKGERFEFETNMLLECTNGIKIYEISISTIYESKTDHKTHFRPLIDSIMIYGVILKYSLSSIASTIVDFVIFAILTGMNESVWISTAIGRGTAAFTNFALNRNVVFQSSGNVLTQLFWYLILVVVSGTISAAAVNFFSEVIPLNVLLIKVIVELGLFFGNYYIQRAFIFSWKGTNKWEN